MNIEEYIKQNKQRFDIIEPSNNHLQKMKQHLGLNNNKILTITDFLKYASIFFILLTSVYLLINKNAENCLPKNFKETQAYYTNLVNKKTKKIISEYSLSKQKINIIKKELTKIDSTYNLSINDICVNPNNDYVINSLTEQYKIKLNIINKILYKLKQTQKNEKTKI